MGLRSAGSVLCILPPSGLWKTQANVPLGEAVAELHHQPPHRDFHRVQYKIAVRLETCKHEVSSLITFMSLDSVPLIEVPLRDPNSPSFSKFQASAASLGYLYPTMMICCTPSLGN